MKKYREKIAKCKSRRDREQVLPSLLSRGTDPTLITTVNIKPQNPETRNFNYSVCENMVSAQKCPKFYKIRS